MKNNIPIIVLFFILTFGCRKEEDNFDYKINGVSDLDFRVDETKEVTLTVSSDKGQAETVALSIGGLPRGVLCTFETPKVNPGSSTNMSITVTNLVKLGSYTLKLLSTSETTSKEIDFLISIDDDISMKMTVYDASKSTSDHPAGELGGDATIKLYTDAETFSKQQPYYTTMTDSVGFANFYHLPSGPYLFTVEKGEASNISSKKNIDGVLKGFINVNVDKYGTMLYRDLNGDGKMSDDDRAQYDRMVLYTGVITEKYIWMSK